MAKVIFLQERCKGCSFCVEFCPKKIIKMSEELNIQGYNFAMIPESDMDKCTACSICALMCPEVLIEVKGA